MNTNEHEWNQNRTSVVLRVIRFAAARIVGRNRAGSAFRARGVSGTRLVKSPSSLFVFIRVHSWFFHSWFAKGGAT
ncbi:MAG: hypothetical protein ACOCP9_05465 [Halofilum sp. (in: g-proteobacteria)]